MIDYSFLDRIESKYLVSLMMENKRVESNINDLIVQLNNAGFTSEQTGLIIGILVATIIGDCKLEQRIDQLELELDELQNEQQRPNNA